KAPPAGRGLRWMRRQWGRRGWIRCRSACPPGLASSGDTTIRGVILNTLRTTHKGVKLQFHNSRPPLTEGERRPACILGVMSERVDLRSDTVTHPTPEMRRAMAEAELGDDVWGDDPTVIALEERAAELTGKEAGLFVASGTMGNLVSEMAQVPRGGEIIL